MDGFGLWVELVKQEAAKHGRVFLLECFEGNERNDALYHDGLEVQELSGFLLTPEQAEEQQETIKRKQSDLHMQQNIDFVFVAWEMEGDRLLIFFELAQMYAPPARMSF